MLRPDESYLPLAWAKVPQIGGVTPGDEVEARSCSSSDRRALGDTLIADGAKVDSQVHVAHEVQVGRHTAMTPRGDRWLVAYPEPLHRRPASPLMSNRGTTPMWRASPVSRACSRNPVSKGARSLRCKHACWLKNFARLRHLDAMVRRVMLRERGAAALRDANGGGD